MSPATNRRAVLGAVLAAGAAIGTGHVAAATAATNEIMESDRRAIEQWVRYRATRGTLRDLALQIEAAEERLPEWAQVEPGAIRPSADDIRAAREARHSQIYEMPEGDQASHHRICTEIWRAILDRKFIASDADYYRKIAEQPVTPNMSSAIAAFEESDRLRDAELAALEARKEACKEAQAAERRRVGLVELQAEYDRVVDEFGAPMDEISSAELRGPHVLALALMIRMDEIHGSEDAIERASLSALRPQLIGAIAEDADRVLAQE